MQKKLRFRITLRTPFHIPSRFGYCDPACHQGGVTIVDETGLKSSLTCKRHLLNLPDLPTCFALAWVPEIADEKGAVYL